MWLPTVFTVIYLTAGFATLDAQSAHLEKPTLTRHPKFEVMYRGESVTFTCTVDLSYQWNFQWFHNGIEIPGSNSTYTIAVLDHPSSGEYHCRANRSVEPFSTEQSDPLTLKVSDLPNPVLKLESQLANVYEDENVEFLCDVDIDTEISDMTFTWYRNKEQLLEDSVVVLDPLDASLNITTIKRAYQGGYTCQIHLESRNLKSELSNTVNVTVYEILVPSLKNLTWTDVFHGERVEMNCGMDDSLAWTYTWYKDGDEVPTGQVSFDTNRATLFINSASAAFKGEYKCKGHLKSRSVHTNSSSGVNLSVYEKKPKPLMTLQPYAEKVYIGEPMSFKCEIKDSAGWEYFLFKVGKEFPLTSNQFDIPHARLANSGTYECMGTRNKTKYDSLRSDRREVFISGIPAPEVKKQMLWSNVFPNESVKLSCEMDGGSDWMFTWSKDGQEVRDGQVSFDTNRATLFISSASAAFKGEYKCKGHLNSRPVNTSSSSGFNLLVYDEMPKVTLTQDPEYKVMFPGESMVFSCHINVSFGWEYTWTKDGSLLPHTENRLTISPQKRSDQGSYKCEAKRSTNHSVLTAKSQAVNIMVEEKKPKPLMTLQPYAEKVYIGEPMSFKCEIKDSAGWEYFLFKVGKEFPLTSNQFDILHATLADSGIYECMGTRNKTKYDSLRSDRRKVIISEIPSPKVKNRTSWLHVFPNENVKLSCEMDRSSDWTFTWYKNGKEIHAGQGVSFDQDAAVLSIDLASASHRGQYSCSGKHKQKSVMSNNTSGLRLDVYDTKPRAQLIQSPDHTLMHTEDSVSLLCHINVSTGWEFLWYKDESPVPVSGNNLTISSVLLEDAGLYKCQTRRGSSSGFSSDLSPTINLSIKVRPKAQILLLTGWSQAFSTDSLVLSCSVQESQDIWNYTWFKEGQQVDQPPSAHTETYTVTPQDDPEQSQYTCRGIRNGRPAYSRFSEQFKTKNLLLKRRVLLSIAGCIVFGISAVCLGCIILRVFRKPAQEDYKPEEADLFLRMDALKDSDDGPCPLVQYITESALNTSPKEEVENGAISSGTPLPETAQEEPATTTESPDATENANSGMVSFKQ